MLKRVDIEHVEVGMYVERLDRPWIETPFLFHKQKIKDASTIDKFKKHKIRFVYINAEKGIDSKKGISESEINQEIEKEFQKLEPELNEDPTVAVVVYEKEVVKATQIKDQAKGMIKGLMQEARLGKNIDSRPVSDMAEQMVDSVIRNVDALSSLSRLKDFDDYTFMHCVNVAVLSITLGRYAGFSRSEMVDLGSGALLHDIGKMRVPQEILNKPERLTKEEFEAMKLHVTFSKEILDHTENITPTAINIAYQHHERYDGSGYPEKLTGDQITISGQIGSIVDVYDAITSDRVYHKGMRPYEALRKIFEWAEFHFNKELVESFVRCLGIYPVGTLIRLNTDQLAVVKQIVHSNILLPVIVVVYDTIRDGYLQPRVIEMGKYNEEHPNHPLTIKKVEDAKKWMINPERFLTP